MSTQEFFAELDGGARQSVAASHFVPLDVVFEQLLGRLDGTDARTLRLAPVPDGTSLETPEGERYEPPAYLSAEGSADALVVRLVGAGGEQVAGRSAPDVAGPPSARPAGAADGVAVYPEELWTAKDAVPLFTHYVRRGQTLPDGVHLR